MSVARAAGSPVDHACDHLYRRHQLSLVNFARLRGCDEHEAWDVVQELFLRVFRLGMVLPLSSRTEEMQRTWLLRTLRWMLINHHRNRSRLKRGSAVMVESLDHLLEHGHDIPLYETPATEHDRRRTWLLIERSLERLRSCSKPSLWPEIENYLCLGKAASTATARVAVHRARVRLGKFIRRENLDGEVVCRIGRPAVRHVAMKSPNVI
ncbi:MAG: hypothetical protein HS117_25735 [Verrucomicrobiaceae bacterium]|nr:hypothetical protein [Verrucomicrobiaceae bacterium]